MSSIYTDESIWWFLLRKTKCMFSARSLANSMMFLGVMCSHPNCHTPRILDVMIRSSYHHYRGRWLFVYEKWLRNSAKGKLYIDQERVYRLTTDSDKEWFLGGVYRELTFSVPHVSWAAIWSSSKYVNKFCDIGLNKHNVIQHTLTQKIKRQTKPIEKRLWKGNFVMQQQLRK